MLSIRDTKFVSLVCAAVRSKPAGFRRGARMLHEEYSQEAARARAQAIKERMDDPGESDWMKQQWAWAASYAEMDGHPEAAFFRAVQTFRSRCLRVTGPEIAATHELDVEWFEPADAEAVLLLTWLMADERAENFSPNLAPFQHLPFADGEAEGFREPVAIRMLDGTWVSIARHAAAIIATEDPALAKYFPRPRAGVDRGLTPPRRLVRVAEAAKVINIRADYPLNALRAAGFEVYGARGSFTAELDDLIRLYPKKAKRLREWADREYPAAE